MNESYHCDELIRDFEKSSDRCEPLWDTKLCWPSASVNETLELPCPRREFDDQTASRDCILFDDGSGIDRPIWTMGNYSYCPDPDNYTGLFIAVAHEKYLQTEDQMWEHKLLMTSQLIYLLSFVVLSVALVVFVLFKKLRNARTRLHMHMLSATIMQVVMWLMHSVLFDTQLLSAYMYLEVLSKINIHVASKFSNDFRLIVEQMFTRLNSYLHYIVLTGLERYFETASLFWLLMEGWFLYELICRKPLETKTSIKRYVIIGWGVPIIVTSPWMAYHVYSPHNDVYWVKHDPTVYLIAVSAFLTFLINLYFFVEISKVLYAKMKVSVQLQQQKKMEHKTWVRSTFMLVFLFGAQNVLYVAWFFVDRTKPKLLFLLIIKVFASFQGIFVAFIYCFLNQEVRAVLRKNLFG
ncbi:hypothetical protein TSAR_000671 [Trichomalopsis sarcophagae]|uniref:G-protein coupled receptors family 2 profile 2 domain-containing protein n=1 Tax=Trichomalopsis sarcophagae TaxID=543379 RepID=A0A232EY46_9HYME|nr:hypothetical protein TSAR_000671 [Trichomalopsis sarcophagae]